jgi:hypothetical protein
MEEAEQMWRENQRMERDLRVLLSQEPTEPNVRSDFHNRRPYQDPNAQPVKWMKLIQWWLVHRVAIDVRWMQPRTGLCRISCGLKLSRKASVFSFVHDCACSG